ncbi:MAG: metalloregulator ArsR/SmtB family transcription factor [Xanthomonadales bacterium]|nr:metalloregulator ArsR/SmtB family transcription factor [Xanthomonadales bacterium]
MDTFSALADPTRRRIVEMLGAGEIAAGHITACFDMSAPAISQHLKVLREAGLVAVRPEGQRRLYRLERSGWDELQAWVDRVTEFWPQRLDALEDALRKAADENGGKDHE